MDSILTDELIPGRLIGAGDILSAIVVVEALLAYRALEVRRLEMTGGEVLVGHRVCVRTFDECLGG